MNVEGKLDSVQNNVVGTGTPIRDAFAKVTGQSRYVGDMSFPGMLYAKVLFSPVAHAKITHIDISKAEALEGVYSVICYKNTPQVKYNSCGEEFSGICLETVFGDTMRYIGDRVAAVAAVDIKTAQQALRLIEVEYQELPIILDPEKALEEGAYPIHEGGNLTQEAEMSTGDVEAGFQSADFIFKNEYFVPPVHHCAIETHTSISVYDYDGRLTIYTPTQDTFGQRQNMEKILGIPMSRIRIISPVIGGGFGGKIDLLTEPVTALLAMKTHRPVKLCYTRKEDICATRTRHSIKIYLKTGINKDGTIIAQDVRAILNTGAYASATNSVCWALGGKVFRIYRTPNIHYKGISAYTNTPLGGAMRGFGSPQLIFALSSQINEMANKLGLDVTEVQIKNVVQPEDCNPLNKLRYGNPRPIDCVKKGKELIKWEDCIKEQQESILENGRYKIGVGMAVGDHGSGLCFTGHFDTSAIILKMNCDGSLILYTGTHDMGNGSVTTQTMIVSEILGIDKSLIGVVQADTDASPYNYGDYASRGTYVAGHAAMNAAKKLRMLLLEQGSQILNQELCLMDIKDSQIYSTLNPQLSCTVREAVMHARKANHTELMVTETYLSENDPVSYGAHFAKVRVDTHTGKVQVLDYAAVHDVGKAINPSHLEGQLHGGIQMGIGYALMEEILLDEKGKIQNSTFRLYHMPTALDMPKTKVAFIEEIEPTGPFGAKSIGECATVPSAPAVSNAVSNALGIQFYRLPVNTNAVHAALNKSRLV